MPLVKAKNWQVGVRLAQADDILFAHQRLAAGINIEESAQRRTLADDGIKLLVAHIQLIAVLGGPAADAVQVAGGGGVHQDGPGYATAEFGFVRFLQVFTLEACVHGKIVHERFQLFRIDIMAQVDHILVPVIGRIACDGADAFDDVRVIALPVEFFKPVYQPREIINGRSQHAGDCEVEGENLQHFFQLVHTGLLSQLQIRAGRASIVSTGSCICLPKTAGCLYAFGAENTALPQPGQRVPLVKIRRVSMRLCSAWVVTSVGYTGTKKRITVTHVLPLIIGYFHICNGNPLSLKTEFFRCGLKRRINGIRTVYRVSVSSATLQGGSVQQTPLSVAETPANG